MMEEQGNTNLSQKRILVVDDDPGQLEILRSYLEPTYIVGTVSYGQFAMDYVKEYATDLILLDILMPVMDGFDCFRAIRNTSEGRNIPVIFFTGKSTRNIVLESISMGVDGYMVKPIAKDQLLDKVSEILTAQENVKNKKTVLAVDDDVSYLKIINSSLKESFKVVMINTEKLAMEYLNNSIPDIVILDSQMPSDSANVILKHIRNDERLMDIPIIMLKGINEKSVMVDEKGFGPDKSLLKPVSKLDLMKAIVAAFSQRGKELN